jgi:4-hydroxy-2-oxoheptanedioate aldolase
MAASLINSGLMIPMINNAQEAAWIVQASKFPPLGVRGQGSPFACWAHGINTAQYVQTANDSLLTIVQIENAEGTKHAEAIAAVDGVGKCRLGAFSTSKSDISDALFIGPNDLHLALFGSAPADFGSKPFLQVLDDIIAAGKRAGKPVGLLLPDGKQTRWAKKRWGADLTMLAIGGDVKALVGWMGKELGEGKSS